MKNIAKLSVVALTVLSLAACDLKAKPAANGPDSASTTVKVDSTFKTTIDSTKADTAKHDTAKKE